LTYGNLSGLFAPAATPVAIELERELMEIVKRCQMLPRLQAMAVQRNGESARNLAQRIAAEIPRWTAIAKFANAKLD